MRQYNVPAIEKTIAILQLLADSSEPLSATQIHTLVGVPKATTFMLLNALERHSVVNKTQAGEYTLGPRLYQWGTRFVERIDVRSIARPFLVALTQDTRLTSHLGTIHDGKIMFVDKVEPESFVRFSTFPGLRQDVHVSSLGKAISAHLPPNRLEALLGSGPLATYTPNSAASVDDFKQRLEVVRKVGFAVEDEEGELGVRCVGAPVFDQAGDVVAAVSVTGIVAQIPSSRIPQLGERVSKASREISTRLGYVAAFEGYGAAANFDAELEYPRDKLPVEAT